MTFKKHVAMAFALAVGLCSTAGAQDIPAELVQWPDTIWSNGTIVTVDNHNLQDLSPGAVVQAMAVRDGKIIALGSDEQVLRLKGPQTRVVDLDGKTVLPGLIEHHFHQAQWTAKGVGRRMFGLCDTVRGYYMNMKVAASRDENLARLKQAVEQLRGKVDVASDHWISIQLLPNPDISFPDIASVSDTMGSVNAADAWINKDDLNQIVGDRMFTVTSGSALGPRDLKEDTWVTASCNSKGDQVVEEVTAVTFAAAQ